MAHTSCLMIKIFDGKYCIHMQYNGVKVIIPLVVRYEIENKKF